MTRGWLKTNWSGLFVRGFSKKRVKYLTSYDVHFCKKVTHINCTDRSI